MVEILDLSGIIFSITENAYDASFVKAYWPAQPSQVNGRYSYSTQLKVRSTAFFQSR